METIYNVDYFIKKFEAIPENQIITFKRHGLGGHCAHGWCDLELQQDFCQVESEEEKAFTKLSKYLGFNGFAGVNNGTKEQYQQPTPKQRILAALYDIKAMQQPAEQPKERVVYKTVVIDSAVKTLQETLTEN